jgi:hypothetical protein
MTQNMLFISLLAMMSDFTALSLIAVWCFAGFLVAMKWLSSSKHDESPSLGDPPDAITVSKWMLWIWFGLDGTGIQEAPEFHRILGPTLMIIYAFLGNTLFLTVLVSILSNTFSKIAADATAEIQFRRAVLTFEGVKSDAIFAYRPPFNILALFFLTPLRFVLSPRWFHKVNITLVRILNAPILLLVALYERRYLWKPTGSKLNTALSKRGKSGFLWWDWSTFSVHGDLQEVFEAEPPESVVQKLEDEEEEELEGRVILENSFAGMTAGGAAGGMRDRSLSPSAVNGQQRRRRLSSVWPN